MSTTTTRGTAPSATSTPTEAAVVRAIMKELAYDRADVRRILTVFTAVVDSDSVSLTGWRYREHAYDIKHLLHRQPIRPDGAHDLLNRYFLPADETFSVRTTGLRKRPVELLITNCA